eukprot:TRINITY_DN3658_c1_g1_i1.p1 TRINITY_DN3658_c1_g1~~TRINITY_DN3658_c1_g1_i1.p1  ORF type:complete len:384 (-),score=39.80 TRINITY_DN3658_c1_g1_i1:99-1250(-)
MNSDDPSPLYLPRPPSLHTLSQKQNCSFLAIRTWSKTQLNIISCLILFLSTLGLGLSSVALLTGIRGNKGINAWQLVFWQSICRVVLLFSFSRRFGIVPLKPITKRFAKLVNVLPILYFISVFSLYQSVKYISLPIIHSWKSTTGLILLLINHYILKKKISITMFQLTLILFIFSTAFIGSYHHIFNNKLSFLCLGLHVVFSIAYGLYHPRVSTFVSLRGNLTLVYYSSLISLPLLVPFVLYSLHRSGPLFYMPFSFEFICIFIINGISSFSVSVSLFWVHRSTSPLFYGLIRPFFTIILCYFSLILFPVYIPITDIIFLFFGLFGIVFLTFLKSQNSSSSSSISSPSLCRSSPSTNNLNDNNDPNCFLKLFQKQETEDLFDV